LGGIAQARSQVLRFGEAKYVSRGHYFCFIVCFKQIILLLFSDKLGSILPVVCFQLDQIRLLIVCYAPWVAKQGKKTPAHSSNFQK